MTPVRKFRSVDEMGEPPWRNPGDPGLFRAMAGLWELGRSMRAATYPAGVQRFASIEDMSRAQEAWAERSAKR